MVLSHLLAGRTDANGHYELAYKRGVMGGMVGSNTVRITISSDVVAEPTEYSRAVQHRIRAEERSEIWSERIQFRSDDEREIKPKLD